MSTFISHIWLLFWIEHGSLYMFCTREHSSENIVSKIIEKQGEPCVPTAAFSGFYQHRISSFHVKSQWFWPCHWRTVHRLTTLPQLNELSVFTEREISPGVRASMLPASESHGAWEMCEGTILLLEPLTLPHAGLCIGSTDWRQSFVCIVVKLLLQWWCADCC